MANMTPLDKAKALLDARRKATQGEWSALVETKDRPVNHRDAPTVVCDRDWVIADVFGGSRRGSNANFIADAANHTEAICNRLVELEAENAKLRARLEESK